MSTKKEIYAEAYNRLWKLSWLAQSEQSSKISNEMLIAIRAITEAAEELSAPKNTRWIAIEERNEPTSFEIDVGEDDVKKPTPTLHSIPFSVSDDEVARVDSILERAISELQKIEKGAITGREREILQVLKKLLRPGISRKILRNFPASPEVEMARLLRVGAQEVQEMLRKMKLRLNYPSKEF